MKALIIDDDVVSRMALADLLSGYGVFDLVEAEDGDQAWALLEAGLLPMICFCDVRMPNMSGIDLLQRMKAVPALGAVPFVLVSSASDRETVLQAVQLGAVGYILKPLHAADARAHLEKIFADAINALAERPAETLKRLNIGPDRLGAYLEAFREQLADAGADLARLLASGEPGAAGARIEALHAGCVTLGLWHAASLFDRVRGGASEAALAAALAGASDAAAHQRLRLQPAPPAAAIA